MKDKIINLLLPLAGLFLLVLCFLIFASTSYAESYFPMTQNQNNNFSQSDIDKINSYFDFDNKFVFISFDGSVTQWGPYYIKYFWVAQVTKGNFNGEPIPENQPTLFGEINSNDYQFSIFENSDYGVSVARYYYDNYANMIGISTSGSLANFYNLNSSSYDTSKSYISNFSLYTDNTFNRSVVLSYGNDDDFLPEFNFEGHATPPNPYQDPVLATGSNYTLPREVPEAPTIINYNWITYAPPSVDNSSIENLLESLTNIVKYNAGYLSTNVSNEFNTLISVIKDYGDFLIKTIQYYVGLVNDNIINGFSNLYDNIVSLFEPMVNAVSYIVEPFDGASVSTAFTSTNFYGIQSQFVSTFTTFENAFDISEPNTFTLTINIQNIDTFYNFGCRSPVIIHLDEHFAPIKAALRTFLWILISFGTVFVVDKGLSNWLRGERKE